MKPVPLRGVALSSRAPLAGKGDQVVPPQVCADPSGQPPFWESEFTRRGQPCDAGHRECVSRSESGGARVVQVVREGPSEQGIPASWGTQRARQGLRGLDNGEGPGL